jgi:hypothetical protein
MRGFGVRVKSRISLGEINFFGGGGDRKDLTQSAQRKAEKILRKEEALTAETRRPQRKPKRTGKIAYAIDLICGLGGGFGAGLQEFFYFLDVGGDVYANAVVHRFD